MSVSASFFTSRPAPRALRTGVLAASLAAMAGLAAWTAWGAACLIHAPRAEAALAAIRSDMHVLAAVREQNAGLAGQAAAETATTDALWIAEKARGGGPLIEAMLARPASARLRAILGGSGGAARHAIVMDERGRNAAIAAPTADFFQGDEPKWRETFGRSSRTRHVSRREPGHDGRFTACWLSEPLIDPVTAEPLGAVAVEVDAGLVRGVLCPTS